MRFEHLIPAPWRDPLEVLAPFAEEPGALALLSGPGGGWSYLARRPVRGLADARAVRRALAEAGPSDPAPDAPLFRGGAAGLAAFAWRPTAEQEEAREAGNGWPDLAVGLYDAVLAFDAGQRRAVAVGRGASPEAARARARTALADLSAPALPPRCVRGGARHSPAGEDDPARYRAAVAAVVQAIASGEIFQANIARAWTGAPPEGATPFDLLRALQMAGAAPFAGYLRLADRAVVSDSPERFLCAGPDGRVEARPIKGTRPRGADPAGDARLAAELLASAKDRAENLMIVDLMRNDLAQVCRPGSVAVPGLCALESFATVHHLVSTVTGRLEAGRTGFDLFAAAFPPGSVTGAPKRQALRVIARHEPPRGPYCGSLFWAGPDGALDSSVLIRTTAWVRTADGRWRVEARAGAGIVADSDPAEEDAEAEAKIAGLLRGFAAL